MYTYRRAAMEDIPLLVRCRIDLLHSALGEGDPARRYYLKEHIEAHYRQAMTA